jgi:DNA-binding NarL/FixJ family response regulator
MTKLRVVLADDHPIVRAGLKAILQPEAGLVVVADVTDGMAAIRVITELEPDIFVTDVALPLLGGIATTEHVKGLYPKLQVLALTAYETSVHVRLMMKAGASGYMLKRTASEDLVRAIRTVAAGSTYIDPALGYPLLDQGSTGKKGARPLTPPPDLSKREAEALQLIALGFSMKELAAKLGLSPRTLETYKARAMGKLGLRSRADIVVYATNQGWLEER